MAAESYPQDWTTKYTDPELRARLKDEVVAGDKGGEPDQWSARKAQLLKAAYEKAAGPTSAARAGHDAREHPDRS